MLNKIPTQKTSMAFNSPKNRGRNNRYIELQTDDVDISYAAKTVPKR